MRRKRKAGSVPVKRLPIFVRDTSSTTGGGLGGLDHNTAGLIFEYRRDGDSSWTTVTKVAGTLGTYVDGGIIADGSLTGAYEIGVPTVAVAAGVESVQVRLHGATNMLPVIIEIELDAVDYQTVAFGAGLASDLANVIKSGEEYTHVRAGKTNVIETVTRN